MTFPDLVVVTGGLSLAGELLVTPARSEMLRVGPPGIVSGWTFRSDAAGPMPHCSALQSKPSGFNEPIQQQDRRQSLDNT